MSLAWIFDTRLGRRGETDVAPISKSAGRSRLGGLRYFRECEICGLARTRSQFFNFSRNPKPVFGKHSVGRAVWIGSGRMRAGASPS